MIAKSLKAAVDGDRERFQECYLGGTGKNKDAINSLFDYLQMCRQFNAALDKKYGVGGALRFRKIQMPFIMDLAFPPEDPAERQKICDQLGREKYRMHNGVMSIPISSPYMFSGGLGKRLHFVQIDGRWFYSTGDMMGNSSDGSGSLVFGGFAKVLKQGIDMMQKRSISMHTLKKELWKQQEMLVKSLP